MEKEERRRGRSRAKEQLQKRNYRPLAMILSLVLVVGCAAGGTLAWLITKTDPVVNTFTYGDIDLKLEETKVNEKGQPVDEDGNVVDEDGTPAKTTGGNDYEMTPGEEYLKDPAVTVLAGNEACWLFIKLEESGGVTITNGDGTTTTYDFEDYLTYAVAEGWTELKLTDAEGKAVEGIYYRYVGEDTDDTEITYPILGYFNEENVFVLNKIKVLDTVTKEMLNALDNNGEANAEDVTYPSLAITAYAVQYSGFEPEVSEGAAESTAEQINAAALKAWEAVEKQNAENTPVNP